MWIAKKLETMTVTAVASVAIIVSTLDLAGVLSGVGWFRNRIPVLTLLAVGAVSAYIIAAQSSASRSQRDTLQSVVHQAIAALGGIEVRSFDNLADYWTYATDRIKDSATIDDLTWGLSSVSWTTARDLAAYKEYRRQIALATTGKKENRNKVYREVFSFPSERRVARAVALMDQRYPNYHLRFYDYDHSGTPLLLQFYVCDNSEVLISSHSESGSPLDSRYMVFKNAQLAEVLSHYLASIHRVNRVVLGAAK